MSLEEDILVKIRPSETELKEIDDAVDALRTEIMNTSGFKETDIELCLVGSIAKGTHLKNPDIDLFLLFDPSVDRASMEKIGVSIGKEAVGGEEHYAEHPYIKGEFMGLKTDIVPAYRLKDASQKLTSVDRTPFHTEYIIEHSDENMRNEIRLMKKFMKGTGVYGAEIKTQGFSGYLSELIVIRYGSFLDALKAVSKWRRHEMIFMEEKSSMKFTDTLIFIDPVDPKRNVASPVSLDTFSKFVHAAGEYLRNPGEAFFFPKPYVDLSSSEIKQQMPHRADMIAIQFERPELIDDIFYGQLGKFERSMVQLLDNHEFRTLHSASFEEGNVVTILIEMVSAELPKAKVHTGPPVWIHDNAQDFIQRWKASDNSLSAPYIEDGNWKVIIGRKYTDALSLIRSEIQKLDIGKNLNELKDDLILTNNENIIENVSAHVLSRFLDKRMPWEIS